MVGVVIPVFGQFDLALACIERACRFTDRAHQILVIDDASPKHLGDFAKHLDERNLRGAVDFIRNPSNLGFPESVNVGFRYFQGMDVAILNSDVMVGPGWLERMIWHARRSDLTATVTALTNEGSVASVRLHREQMDLCAKDSLNALNCELQSLPTLPPVTLPVGVGHCMLITSLALATAGLFSNDFAPGYGEEADFSIRCTSRGLIHLLATDVLVWHEDGASFGHRRDNLKRRADKMLEQRYPGYIRFVQSYDFRSDLAETAFMRVLIQLRGLRVLIDGRMIMSSVTGAGNVALELTRNLASLLGPGGLVLAVHQGMVREIRDCYSDISVVSVDALGTFIDEHGKFDVVLRPGQVSDLFTLEILWQWARRVAVLQLDFIAFDNWLYHPSVSHYRQYQDAATAVALLADAVHYLSKYVHTESSRTAPRLTTHTDIVSLHCGVDHVDNSIPRLNTQHHQVVVLGASFNHKNRGYAIQMLRSILDLGSVQPRFIFVGPDPSTGSSIESDRDLARELDVEPFVEFRPWALRTEVEELLASSSVALYPSLSEGFGLVPFEAALSGCAPIFSKRNSLAEILPDIPLSLSLTDPRLDAEVLLNLLESDESRQQQIAYTLRKAGDFKWSTLSVEIFNNLREVAISPPRVPQHLRYEFFLRPKASIPLFLRIRSHPLVMLLFPPGTKQTKLGKRVYRWTSKLPKSLGLTARVR